MIELTREVLAELGLLPKGARPRFNIALTRGASLSTDVWLDDGSFVHVKASELERLDAEHRRTCAAWERYPGYTAEPLGIYALLAERTRIASLRSAFDGGGDPLDY